MNSEHFIGEIAQKAVIVKDGKALIVLPPGDAFWDLPGGRLNPGESPADGLAREVQEELGVDAEVGQVFFADVWRPSKTEPGSERYFVAFKCVLKNADEPFVFQKEEIAEAKWIEASEVDTLPIYDICKRALKAYFG